MSFTKEQQQEYYQRNKEKKKQQRRERYRARKSIVLPEKEVEQNLVKNFLSESKVEQISQVEQKLKVEQFIKTPKVEHFEVEQQNRVEQKSEAEQSEKVDEKGSELEKVIREDDRFITYQSSLNFQTWFWDKKFQKSIYHSCADSCWEGKYCVNCSSQMEKQQKLYSCTHCSNNPASNMVTFLSRHKWYSQKDNWSVFRCAPQANFN